MYARLYGTLVTITGKNKTAYVKVTRKHLNNDSTQFSFDTSEAKASQQPLSVLFGAHELSLSDAFQASNFFVKDAHVKNIILHIEREKAETPTIRTTERLWRAILNTAKLEIDSKVIPVSSIEQYALEMFETLKYPQWKTLLQNEPLQLFATGWINNYVSANDEPQSKQPQSSITHIEQSTSRVHLDGSSILQRSTLKNIHYHLGASNNVSLFIPAIDSKTTRRSPSVDVMSFVCSNEVERDVFENIFLKHFPMYYYS